MACRRCNLVAVTIAPASADAQTGRRVGNGREPAVSTYVDTRAPGAEDSFDFMGRDNQLDRQWRLLQLIDRPAGVTVEDAARELGGHVRTGATSTCWPRPASPSTTTRPATGHVHKVSSANDLSFALGRA